MNIQKAAVELLNGKKVQRDGCYPLVNSFRGILVYGVDGSADLWQPTPGELMATDYKIVKEATCSQPKP